MIKLSLTEFVDFVMKSGSPKLTAVREIKKRHEEGYHPSHDFYRKVRDGIVEHHKTGKPRFALDGLKLSDGDRNKVIAYPLIVQGYGRFLGRKTVDWFDPRKGLWQFRDLAVSVNPELGLNIDGEPYLIKMYFKKDQPSKFQVASVLHLMQLTLRRRSEPRKLGLLDVRRGRLIPAGTFDATQTLLLEGEAVAFARIYKGL